MELSLLDRLAAIESPLNRWEQRRELERSLCRDLTDLLNTRRAEQDFDAGYEEATNSLLSFGIPDFTSYDLKNTIEQERVRCSIERAIRQFEPRLARVKVLLEKPDLVRPTLRFPVEAQLRDGADAEDVVFDATLQRDSRRIAVSGADR
jgi:type VI secretion system protein ImpF